jgi:hypothetical protein
LRYRFLAEGTANLLQREQFAAVFVLDEVDIRETALYCVSPTSDQLTVGTHTSPSRRRSLKLRLLILSCGLLGKQHMQSVKL